VGAVIAAAHSSVVGGGRCQPPNKRSERTVMRHRGDAASAPFHYALASRFTRRRAAAQPQR
jgi:hypothetical protein